MKTKYIIELYDPIKRVYNNAWIGRSYEMVNKMFNKPYYKHSKRRLIKVQTEILDKK